MKRDLKEKLNDFNSLENLFSKEDKILVAVSGGVDSMVLADLLYRSGFSFSIAHCNFKLRGEEADSDEEFVSAFSKKIGVEFYSVSFQTSEYSESRDISIQMAARELRYTWLEKVREENGLNKIATAHHLNDVAETFLYNLTRETGIAGLHGILPINGFLVRPLVFCSKKEIKDYARANAIPFREDTSNLLEKYTRNKIRKRIIPEFEEINPDFLNSIHSTIRNLRETEKVYQWAINEQVRKIVESHEGNTMIEIESLKKLPSPHAVTFEILREFGFNSSQSMDVFQSLDALPGKMFYSEKFELLKDRESLIIREKHDLKSTPVKIERHTKDISDPLHLSFEIREKESIKIDSDPHLAFLDYDKLKFPMVLRGWEQGDHFAPLGMKGNKKVSDFLIDNKVPVLEKQRTYVLVSGEKIVWVLGHRISNNFKIGPETKNIYLIKWIKEGIFDKHEGFDL